MMLSRLSLGVYLNGHSWLTLDGGVLEKGGFMWQGFGRIFVATTGGGMRRHVTRNCITRVSSPKGAFRLYAGWFQHGAKLWHVNLGAVCWLVIVLRTGGCGDGMLTLTPP
jgi:hypothetical protein